MPVAELEPLNCYSVKSVVPTAVPEDVYVVLYLVQSVCVLRLVVKLYAYDEVQVMAYWRFQSM